MLDGLSQLESNSVHCVVTSPPYWGLRDYGTASWAGGDEGCNHAAPDEAGVTNKPTSGQRQHAGRFAGPECYKCGATRIDNQVGLEKTPELYVEKLVKVFQEVRRVLRDDGTVWLNLGDSYAGAPAGNFGPNMPKPANGGAYRENKPRMNYGTLKPKDLVGVPWRVAFALQADGWWLRSEITWCKLNPMPESVTDRPTTATEKIFLLTKSERYYWDADAVREPPANYERKGGSAPWTAESGHTNGVGSTSFHQMSEAGRNMRNYWLLATQPYPDAHFATFPEEIAKRCILAGTSERGCCVKCGSPWERVVERESQVGVLRGAVPSSFRANVGNQWPQQAGITSSSKTIGWQPTCKCNAETNRCVVLDPFAGSGTVGAVALELGRKAVLIELNEKYCELIERRTSVTYGMQF